jgi:uncharacterized protein
MINRTIHKAIVERLYKGKAIIILGPRQSGKTTLLKKIQQENPNDTQYYNCDEAAIRNLFSVESIANLKSLIGNNRLILLDEAQRIQNAGLTLKLIVDNIPNTQIIASGSSAFELSDQLNEPLTGRKFELNLLPFSFQELADNVSPIDEISNLNQRILFGSYPDIVNNPGNATEILTELCSSYLFKDVFTLYDIRKPEVIEKLLTALALQISSEVSYNELAQLLKSDPATIERYTQILERAFIIFRLPNFSTNQRNEIKKSRKIYFYDCGIRNALISDFRPLDIRQDTGKLWENYVVSEFIKLRTNWRKYSRSYFWRSLNSGEIDYLELEDRSINAYEIKWNTKKKAKTRSFQNLYPNATVELINPSNYYRFLLSKT